MLGRPANLVSGLAETLLCFSVVWEHGHAFVAKSHSSIVMDGKHLVWERVHVVVPQDAAGVEAALPI